MLTGHYKEMPVVFEWLFLGTLARIFYLCPRQKIEHGR